jgi:curved DNA-binding protein
MVEIKPNPRFERVGDNLRVTAPLELHTALLGGEVNVSTVDRTVKLHIPAGTDHGTVFRLRGLGMPHLANSGQRGDLYVTVELQLPRDLSQDEKKLLQQWQAMRKQSPSESNHSRNESM